MPFGGYKESGWGREMGHAGSQQLPRDQVGRHGPLSEGRHVASVRPARPPRAAALLAHPGQPGALGRWDSILEALRAWADEFGRAPRRQDWSGERPQSAAPAQRKWMREHPRWPCELVRGGPFRLLEQSAPGSRPARFAASRSRTQSPSASRRRGGWPRADTRCGRSPTSSGSRSRASTTICAPAPAPTAADRSPTLELPVVARAPRTNRRSPEPGSAKGCVRRSANGSSSTAVRPGTTIGPRLAPSQAGGKLRAPAGPARRSCASSTASTATRGTRH